MTIQVAEFNEELRSDSARLAELKGLTLLRASPPCQLLSPATAAEARAVGSEFG